MQYLSLPSILFFVVMLAIAVVFLIMFFRMLKFRKSSTSNFHHGFWAELVWFLVPILILAMLLWPIAKLFVLG